MLLGTRNYANNDVRQLIVNYCEWLLPGYVLNTVTASITPATAQSTVGAVTLDAEKMVAYVPVTCASVNESFTLALQATDTFGQTVNDQININVVAPGAT